MQQSTRRPPAPAQASGAFPSARVLLRCLLRTWLVGAGFNTRGMQNIGLAYAIDPGLVQLYRDPEALRQARVRYATHYNTHPFWTPLLVGIFLGMERKIAKGLFPPEMLENVRATTVYTLSAIGDSLFGGSVLVFWSLSCACLVAAGQGSLAVALGALLFQGLVVFKALTFWMGFCEGLTFLHRLGRWNLINWSQRVKLFNAVLLVAFWALAWPADLAWFLWLPTGFAFAAVGMILTATGLSREILAVLAVAAYLGLPWLMRLAAGLSPI
ncbi:PTS system mannose/fructose/sorbose family transporter subunit IID [Desulfocurvus sp.]|uniref:PTS system mannose/fructose/sorbose family transporter subunit IID n=1 Tax=Desulfocurvus sp. TaxID=2871698 RepID=UPI0025C27DCB|nr:PTS system mannose/fructose/sorbose family transporter subunit IID [Desulfocurvus sp.]MCK9240293.1 PTS system mannose/fructose/sorbose family transporter subunit IID [Desulfocurvus sp.]